MSQNVSSLFQGANDNGALSNQSLQALTVVDLGAQIQAGLGVNADDVKASEVTLMTQLIDDSGSIRFVQGNTEAVRNGHNLVIESLFASKQKNSILGHTRYLNGEVLFDYRLISQAVRMDTSNYNPNGGTPLYDQSIVTFGTVLAKVQEFRNSGVPVRAVTLIVSDGADEHSRQKAGDVKSIVDDMLRSEMHIISAMGISDGKTDFYEVFSGWKEREIKKAKLDGTLQNLEAKGGMGIPPRWIRTPKDSPSEIRREFELFSQSAVRASQGAASFSQAAMGGFGSP